MKRLNIAAIRYTVLDDGLRPGMHEVEIDSMRIEKVAGHYADEPALVVNLKVKRPNA